MYSPKINKFDCEFSIVFKYLRQSDHFIKREFMQTLKIKNFGPIKDVKMEINNIMIFIGPQASGKSTIAKNIFYFNSVKDFVYETVEQILVGSMLSI